MTAGKGKRALMGVQHGLARLRAVVHLLGDFSVWYNAVRPHQNLAELTPDEAWYGTNPYANAPKSVHWFEAWDGLLKGYYLRC